MDYLGVDRTPPGARISGEKADPPPPGKPAGDSHFHANHVVEPGLLERIKGFGIHDLLPTVAPKQQDEHRHHQDHQARTDVGIGNVQQVDSPGHQEIAKPDSQQNPGTHHPGSDFDAKSQQQIANAIPEHHQDKASPAQLVDEIEDKQDLRALLAESRLRVVDGLDAITLASQRGRHRHEKESNETPGDQANHALDSTKIIGHIAALEETPSGYRVGKARRVSTENPIFPLLGQQGKAPIESLLLDDLCMDRVRRRFYFPAHSGSSFGKFL